MSATLEELAKSLGVNERSLRRAWALGMLRGRRITPHRLELSPGERVYLRGHWRTLSLIRRALRTEPNVSMAVVFGSTARGDEDASSDVDLLVALRDVGVQPRVALAERLRTRTGLDLEVISLDDALRHPSLMVEILHDGRVAVDRDGRWPELRAQSETIRAEAERVRCLQDERAREAVEAFERRAEASA
jgi:predicted nucleotidyltransferase